jgi:hypothetical protein
MASPKVFISSTCFDLRDIRDSLSRFVENFGFDPVLSEYGDVFYHPDLHTHDACIQEISNCQLFILIVGGRFGGSYVNDREKSITNAEYEAAKELKIPIFTYIKKSVLENHHLYVANRSKPFISQFEFTAIEKQEHAVDIFNFIDNVRKAKTNNAFEGFDTAYEIEIHLRKQWAGMFFDFLKNREVREQINVAKVMLSTLQTSSEKMEELVKGLYLTTKTSETDELLEDIDVKYSAIEFFNLVLGIENHGCDAYLGEENEIDTLAKVAPAKLEWYEYLVKLGCYSAGEIFDEETGDTEPTVEYCGLGFTAWAGFVLDREGKHHQDKKENYEKGIKHLGFDQRREIIAKFVKKEKAHK